MEEDFRVAWTKCLKFEVLQEVVELKLFKNLKKFNTCSIIKVRWINQWKSFQAGPNSLKIHGSKTDSESSL